MGNIKKKWGNHRPWPNVVVIRVTKLVEAKVVNVANVKEATRVRQQR
jgi:hypothetical protein